MRRLTFHLHWLVGLIAGTLLMVIGASGAALAFEDEILDWLNPGVRVLARAGQAGLTLPELLPALQENLGDRRIANVTVYAEPQRSVRVMLQAAPGGRPGVVYADPHSGRILGAARGQAFFDWTERLHRFLLLPREAGRVAAGILSGSLLLLVLSGIYLRWPARVGSLREWLGVNLRLRGRPLLWNLHAVVATWAVPVWLILAGTGIYWAFDGVRSVVDGWAGVQRQVRPRQGPGGQHDTGGVDLRGAWDGFASRAGAWNMVRLSPPGASAKSVEIVWLPPDAAHERALNRMQIGLDGQIRKDERFVAQSPGKRGLAAIYPLHMGRYFGLPGRLAMAFGALALPLLGLTGWWLYLQRSLRASRTRRESDRLSAAPPEHATDGAPVLIAYASQTGHAESIALRTARCLQEAGRHIALRPLAQMSPPELAAYPQALFIVSTYGDGQAPDAARGFARALAGAGHGLQRLNYAVLALGNRQYPNFCGFGRFLHERLQQLGAAPQAAVHMVCESQANGYREWFASLRRFGAGMVDGQSEDDGINTEWMECILAGRKYLNPGSSGAPLYELNLPVRDGGVLPRWAPGALLEVRPRHAAAAVKAWGGRFGLKDEELVEINGGLVPLVEALAERRLPEEGGIDVIREIHRLPMLAPRRYSVASIVGDGSLQLIVRQHFRADKLGLASGWLTEHCPVGGEIAVRLLGNPSFGVTVEAVPCVFIGAGSGLAGLRGLLRERMRHRLGQNWLILGERHAQFDTLCAEEFDAFCAAGLLQVDRVFSRDVTPPAYVQDCLREHAIRLRQLVDAGGHLHVCGSRGGMGESVDEALREILGYTRVDDLATAGRYRRDVY